MHRLGLALVAVGFTASLAYGQPSHGLSAFGNLKYPADFSHFDYVNPNAPKGGRIVTIGTEGRITFDSLNGYILKGVPGQKLDLLFDSLMVRADDEPDAVYGLIAKSADLAVDHKSVRFRLRTEAKFSDGTGVTGQDVCTSFKLLKEQGHPQYRVTLRNVSSCTVVAPDLVRYDFEGDSLRDLPMIVATLPVFSADYYQTREFDKTTLEPPLGSGPYKISAFKQGSFISYQRREDYWAKDLPVNRGRYNFDEIKLLYFRDRTAELEALKSGTIDLREEFTSKSWATEYDIKAVRDGRLIKATLPDHRAAGTQGFFLNMRRAKFADIKVREALALAFDFEWTNTNLFYGLYNRTMSFFENSDMAAKGPPSVDEMALLKPYQNDLPPAAFGPAVTPPVSDGSGQDRALLRRASKLFDEAGWKRDGGIRKNAAGEKLSVEFLIFAPGFERVIAPFVKNLKLIGVAASIRQVEAAQYQQRQKTFDFDITIQRYAMAQTPGVELASYFSSTTANQPGSFNLAGIANKAIDGLITNIIKAKDRSELTVATRALDRGLRSFHLWVPHWYKASHGIVYWNKFLMPAQKPRFSRGILDCWWIDAEKAKNLKQGS